MKEFSELTLQRLNENGEYYVYGLIDPRNDRIFYIGKGTGNRVFQHVAESDKNPESEKEKLKIIKSIEESQKEVKHILINWGLTESEAFAAETALINLMNFISANTLTNIVAGHHGCGCLSVEEVEREYGATLLDSEDFRHKLLIIKINRLYNRHMNSQELYDIARGIWRADINRAKQVEYVLGVYNNLIVCCYKPDRWYKVFECSSEKLPKHTYGTDMLRMENRILFECDNLNTSDENQSFYLYKSIEKMEHIQKSQNPITYIGV